MHKDFSNQRSGRARGLRFAWALGFLTIFVIAVTGACSSGDEEVAATGANSCIGGVINPETGVCEGKCTPDKCLAGNICVGNSCRLKCDSHVDCLDTQDCTAGLEDDTMMPVSVCKPHDQATGFGWQCFFGTECDATLACPDGSKCDQCGGNPAACVEGLCPDMSPCKAPACNPAECKPLTCLTEGEGDADAYCSMLHCSSDAQCPGGYYCGVARDPHLICGTMKGNTPFCGETTEPCIDPADFTKDGASYFEGGACLLRKQCMKRGQCAPCESDLDCAQFPAQRCVTVGPDNRCARDCTTDGDCDPDYFCVPNPTPNNPNNGSCVPRFGACKGTGQFCEPCLDDTDCGDANSTVVCVNGAGGQRACFDRSFPDSCATDTDCPTSPSGKHGECLDDAEGYSAGHPLYHRCYLPYKASTNKYGCW